MPLMQFLHCFPSWAGRHHVLVFIGVLSALLALWDSNGQEFLFQQVLLCVLGAFSVWILSPFGQTWLSLSSSSTKFQARNWNNAVLTAEAQISGESSGNSLGNSLGSTTIAAAQHCASAESSSVPSPACPTDQESQKMSMSSTSNAKLWVQIHLFKRHLHFALVPMLQAKLPSIRDATRAEIVIRGAGAGSSIDEEMCEASVPLMVLVSAAQQRSLEFRQAVIMVFQVLLSVDNDFLEPATGNRNNMLASARFGAMSQTAVAALAGLVRVRMAHCMPQGVPATAEAEGSASSPYQ